MTTEYFLKLWNYSVLDTTKNDDDDDDDDDGDDVDDSYAYHREDRN